MSTEQMAIRWVFLKRNPFYTYLFTVNVKHTLSCTRPNRIAAKGVGVPHRVVAGRRAWPKT